MFALRTLDDAPPENATVMLHFSHEAHRGWMTRRLLGGTPTWWIMAGDGVARCVEPIGWSIAP